MCTDFCTRNFLGWGGAGWAAMPPLHWLLLCLRVIVKYPGFVHGHQSRQEIIWIAHSRKNTKSCSDDWHRWRFLSAFRHFGTHFAESFRMSKPSWMMDPTRSREIPSCAGINSSKVISWIWSIISCLVTVLGRSGRCATQVEKLPRLN